MKKTMIAAFALCCSSALAWADQVTTIYAGGSANGSGACVFFQTKDYGATWFAVPYSSDAGYQTEFNILQEAHTTQTNNFGFSGVGSACGVTRASGIYIQGP